MLCDIWNTLNSFKIFKEFFIRSFPSNELLMVTIKVFPYFPNTVSELRDNWMVNSAYTFLCAASAWLLVLSSLAIVRLYRFHIPVGKTGGRRPSPRLWSSHIIIFRSLLPKSNQADRRKWQAPKLPSAKYSHSVWSDFGNRFEISILKKSSIWCRSRLVYNRQNLVFQMSHTKTEKLGLHLQGLIGLRKVVIRSFQNLTEIGKYFFQDNKR